jgi:uncharacterized damage-inducible protein DinB
MGGRDLGRLRPEMLCYMLAHEAHHRGQVCMLAHQLGFPLRNRGDRRSLELGEAVETMTAPLIIPRIAGFH